MLIGALIGAGFDIAIQLIANKGDFDKIKWKQVGISAIAGATGAGIGQLLSGAVKLTGITNALANAVAKGAIIGAASGAGASAVTSVMMGRRGWDLVKDIAQGALIGGAIGGAGEWLKFKWNNRQPPVPPVTNEPSPTTVNVDDVIQELPNPGTGEYDHRAGEYYPNNSEAVGGKIVKIENSEYLTVQKGNKTFHISETRVKEFVANPLNPESRWGDQINFKKYGVPDGSKIIQGMGKGHKRTPTPGELKMFYDYFKK